MKVGILSLPFEPNYGWAVQLWALYHTIEQLGHEPVILDRRWNQTQSGLLYNMKRFIYYNVICRRFSTFIYNEITNITPVVRDSANMTQLSNALDAVVVGSDQVWRIENTRGADLNFFLDFVISESVKRISYAASFGKDTWQGTSEETALVKQLLAKFSTITVRENTGVTLCKELFDANATNVLDPTLLLNSRDYNSVLSAPRNKSNLTTYILDATTEKTITINKISENKKLNVVSLYPKKRVTYYKSVYYWLESIRDAKYVIVDSFHGMVFSIIFHKNFAVMANSKRGMTRFTSLLSQLGLENRLTNDYSYESINKILSTEIDYEQVERNLQELRSYSLSILRDSLSK